MTKTCTRCGEEKDISDFHRNRRKSDGLDPSCKACNNERMRSKYASDPEWRAQKIARTRAYHLENPEWSQERLRESHVRHRDRRAERAKERGLDPEVRRRRRAASRRSEARRRALKAQAARVEAITQPQLDTLLAEYEGRCAICDREVGLDLPLHWDHIQPLSRNGVHTLSNHQPLCGPCNIRKNAIWPLTPERVEQIKQAVLAAADLGVSGRR